MLDVIFITDRRQSSEEREKFKKCNQTLFWSRVARVFLLKCFLNGCFILLWKFSSSKNYQVLFIYLCTWISPDLITWVQANKSALFYSLVRTRFPVESTPDHTHWRTHLYILLSDLRQLCNRKSAMIVSGQRNNQTRRIKRTITSPR